MKKTLLSLAIGALLLTVPRGASADVSVDFFYNNLSGGSWIEVDDYGYCWQPDLAVGNANWRPYSDGYWAYTDLGWTWVSYEDFGWATYHYGRWAMLSDYGWVWVPGRDADLEWGPAWVSWRTGGEYIGWAPLPPETVGLVESRPLSGAIDVEFNIGPAYYNFVDVRYIGEPVLRERIVPYTQNVTYIQQTVNVTNITYRNKTVYNYGPDINVINRTSSRPIQRLRLEREQNVDFATAAKSGGLTKVQGDRLLVGAPERVTRSARQIAPPAVKTKVAAAKVDRGWSMVGDEKAQSEFKQRLKGQRNVPPPTGGAAAGQANAEASASPGAPATGGGTETATATQQGAQGQGRRGQRGTEGVTATSPAASPATSAAPVQGTAAEQGRVGRGQGRPANRFPGATEQGGQATGAETGANPTQQGASEQGQAQGQGRGRGQRGEARTAPTSAQGAETNAASPPGTTGAADQQSRTTGGEGRRAGRAQMQEPNAEAGAQPGARGQGRRLQNQPAETAPGDVQGQGRGPRGQRESGQGAGQAGQGQQGQPGQAQGEGRRSGKKAQGEASPAATPQQ